MASVAKTLRKNKALRVLEKTNEGLPVVQACKEVGMKRSTFYNLIDRDPQILIDFQEKLDEVRLQNLFLITISQTKLLERAIEKGFSDNAKLPDLIKLIQMLEDVGDKLAAGLRINTQGDDAIAKEILSGPVLRPSKSRLSVSE